MKSWMTYLSLMTVICASSCNLTKSKGANQADPVRDSKGDTASQTDGTGQSTDTDTGEWTDTETTEVDAGLPDAGLTTATLLVAPLVFATTADGFSLNVVTYTGDPKTLLLFVAIDATKWVPIPNATYPFDDVVEWRVTGLSPGKVYPYAVVTCQQAITSLDAVTPSNRDILMPMHSDHPPGVLSLGEVVTQRAPSESFRFAVVADTHLRPHDTITPDMDVWAYEEITFQAVIADLANGAPDFVIHLGDVVDYNEFGFNDPPPSAELSRRAYLNYRRMYGDLIAMMTHFMTIGNWDGENGDFTDEEIERSRQNRLMYVPNPAPDDYPEGGGLHEDYYAFTWGDALFIVLNVMSYTTTPHKMGDDPGAVDDWTLGEAQLSWFADTLAAATSKWRFVFIHHTVGGKAGDLANSAYGRGGGLAAYVGEQAIVHDLMRSHGVQIFFFGHDHVFMDMVVDGIHYTLPGSAGAEWKFVPTETGYDGTYYSDSGHGLVTVTKEQVQVDFIAMGGELLSSYVVP